VHAITKRKRLKTKEEEEEKKEENDDDDDDDYADLDRHGKGVSVTAGGKKRGLTRFRHDRTPLAARPISRHFWINHRTIKVLVTLSWNSSRTFSRRTGVRTFQVDIFV